MRKISEKPESWVVYKMAATVKGEGLNAVCERDEWDKIEITKPGVNTLIQAGISNEGVAERLARGTSGDTRKSHGVQKDAWTGILTGRRGRR